MATTKSEEEFISSYRDGKIENIQTYSNVGYQDHITIEDLDDITNLFSKNFGLKSLIKSSVYTAIESVDDNVMSFANDVSGLLSKDGKTKIIEEKINFKEDENNIKSANKILYDIRNNINIKKSIKTNINKNAPYNSISNFAGLAAITMVGALGRDPKIFSEFKDMNIFEKIINVSDHIMGLPRTTAKLADVNILDQDEIIELNTATFENFFSKKPGVKIGLGKNSPSRNEKIVNAIENARITAGNYRNFYLGELVVEPYYNGYEEGEGNNKTEFVSYTIPFQFNANITEGSLEAKYNEEEIINRILPIRTWISTSSSPLTLETTYVALAPDNAGVKSDAEVYNYQTDRWMFDWTESRINEIELKLRSLVLPNLNNGRFVRPPIVKIKMTKGIVPNTLMDLYSYPALQDEDLKITIGLDGRRDGYKLKRYVVTSLQISPLEDYANSFSYFNNGNNQGLKRRGFKVSMSLSEVTKNFLDLVPDFRTYYKAWHDQEAINSELNNDYKNILENKVKNLSEDGEVKNEVVSLINEINGFELGNFDFITVKKEIFDKIKKQKFSFSIKEKYDDIAILKNDLYKCFYQNNILENYKTFFDKEIKKINSDKDSTWFSKTFFNGDKKVATYYYLEETLDNLTIKINNDYKPLESSEDETILKYVEEFKNYKKTLQEIKTKEKEITFKLEASCKNIEGYIEKINDDSYNRIIKKYKYITSNNGDEKQVENIEHYILYVLDNTIALEKDYNFIAQFLGLWGGVGVVSGNIYKNLTNNNNKNVFYLERILKKYNNEKIYKKVSYKDVDL